MNKDQDLLQAVIANDITLVQQLLDSGADANATYKSSKVIGWSGLHLAAQNVRSDIATLLLDNGAVVDVEDGYGNTPLWTATFNSRGNGSVIELLIERGADSDHQNHAGKSPRDLAQLIANDDVNHYFP